MLKYRKGVSIISILVKNVKRLLKDGIGNGDLAVGEQIENTFEGKEYSAIFDGDGLTAIPGLIDMHVHFRDPMDVEKEDVISGSKAAANSGHTFVNLMYDSVPELSIPETLDYVLEKVKEVGLVDAEQSVFIGRKKGEPIKDFLIKLDKRVKTVVIERSANLTGEELLLAMKHCHDNNLLLMIQAEDRTISNNYTDISEYIESVRCCDISMIGPYPIHFTHAASSRAIEAMVEYRKMGGLITSDITPHHILLENNSFKVNPPIKSSEERKKLADLILNKGIEVIATDHAPLSEEDLNSGKTGIVGLETAFGLMYGNFVDNSLITLSDLVDLMSLNPAKLLKLNKGKLEEGFDGDVFIFDPNVETVVNPENFQSKSRNTPFVGSKMKGLPVLVIKGGKVTYLNEAYKDRLSVV